MARTRSQSKATISIKREEEDSKTELKHTLLLNGISNTTKNTAKIVKKRNKSQTHNKNPLPVSGIKSEEESDEKALLQAQKSNKFRYITQEQIKQLISYIVKDKMTVKAAAIKANMGKTTADRFYGLYRNDPERKIPEAFNPIASSTERCTKEKMNTLIHYIVEKKMPITTASRKLNISYSTALKYHQLYKEDPERKIPKVFERSTDTNAPRTKSYTQEQITTLIKYIVDDKMSVRRASIKINMSERSGQIYYNMYMEDPDRKIPEPCTQTKNTRNRCTQEQIRRLIDCVVNEKMSVTAASRKVKMSEMSGFNYYGMYVDDPERKIPKPKTQTADSTKRLTQEQIKSFIHFVINDKMSIRAASKKVNMHEQTGRKYYTTYMNDPERKIPITKGRINKCGKPCTQDQITSVIGFIVKDKLPIIEAARKANMNDATARKYYTKYLRDPEHKIPTPETRSFKPVKPHSEEQIKELINYIVNDKMTIKNAAKITKIPKSTAWKYYNRYSEDIEQSQNLTT